MIPLAARAFQTWDATRGAWTTVPGRYRIHASRTSTHDALSAPLTIPAAP